jgi:hypothetical protein
VQHATCNMQHATCKPLKGRRSSVAFCKGTVRPRILTDLLTRLQRWGQCSYEQRPTGIGVRTSCYALLCVARCARVGLPSTVCAIAHLARVGDIIPTAFACAFRCLCCRGLMLLFRCWSKYMSPRACGWAVAGCRWRRIVRAHAARVGHSTGRRAGTAALMVPALRCADMR